MLARWLVMKQTDWHPGWHDGHQVFGVVKDNAATPGEQRPLKAGGARAFLYRAPCQLDSLSLVLTPSGQPVHTGPARAAYPLRCTEVSPSGLSPVRD